jgi:SAM-dependent methyltransferase
MITDVGRCASCNQDSHGLPLCPACDARARSSYIHLSGDGQGNYEDALFALLEGLEPQSFWFRSRNELIVWAVRRYLGDAASFLEIGCGTGFVLAAIHERVPKLQIMGAELYAEGLEVARRRLPGVPLVQMSALEVPFSAGFDAVGVFDVLEHIEDDEGALREMRRAVRRNGGIVITVPQHPQLWSAADDFAGHVRRYRRDELLAKLKRAGWEPVRVTSFVTLALPFFVASRALRARGPDAYDLESELLLPRSVDRFLGGVMGVERGLVTRGLSFPVGASLLLVGRAT